MRDVTHEETKPANSIQLIAKMSEIGESIEADLQLSCIRITECTRELTLLMSAIAALNMKSLDAEIHRCTADNRCAIPVSTLLRLPLSE